MEYQTTGWLSPKLKQLEADNARLREELAAAQATIEQMREALLDVARKAEALKKECGMNPESPQAIRNGEYMNISYAARDTLLSVPTNLDALHEARAEALERADRIFMQMSLELRDGTLRFAYGAARDVLKNEAAAHRARKEGK